MVAMLSLVNQVFAIATNFVRLLLRSTYSLKRAMDAMDAMDVNTGNEPFLDLLYSELYSI